MAQSKYNFPVGFHFKVEFTGIETTQNDHQFQSVSGLSIDLETEEIAEGGENRFKHKIPVRTKFPNLVLKGAFNGFWCNRLVFGCFGSLHLRAY